MYPFNVIYLHVHLGWSILEHLVSLILYLPVMENVAIRVRPPSFKIEIPGSVDFKDNSMQKVQTVRETLVHKLQKPVNNADIFEAALDSWIAQLTQQDGGGTPQVCTWVALPENHTNQEMYIVAKSSLHNIIEFAGEHA